MQSESSYETSGALYLLKTMHGTKGLIGLSLDDHCELISRGFKDEEVYITVKKADCGTGYAQQVPEHKIRAGLCTIKIEGAPKFQLSLDAHAGKELQARGFEDGDRVLLTIELSPYRMPSEPFKVEELNLKI